MTYNITDKLKFEKDPEIEIKGKAITVKSDAETVLTLLDLLQTRGELAATREAFPLLFSEKDQKTVRAMKLKFEDYSKLLEVAVSLALGEDPDAPSEDE